MATSFVLLIWSIKWNKRNPVWGHCKPWEAQCIERRGRSPHRRGFSSSLVHTFCGKRLMLFWTSVLPLTHLPLNRLCCILCPGVYQGVRVFRRLWIIWMCPVVLFRSHIRTSLGQYDTNKTTLPKIYMDWNKLPVNSQYSHYLIIWALTIYFNMYLIVWAYFSCEKN